MTGDNPSLTRYETARAAVAQDEDTLRQMTPDNHNQQRRLDVFEVQVRAPKSRHGWGCKHGRKSCPECVFRSEVCCPLGLHFSQM
jgi:hypothetical protein